MGEWGNGALGGVPLGHWQLVPGNEPKPKQKPKPKQSQSQSQSKRQMANRLPLEDTKKHKGLDLRKCLPRAHPAGTLPHLKLPSSIRWRDAQVFDRGCSGLHVVRTGWMWRRKFLQCCQYRRQQCSLHAVADCDANSHTVSIAHAYTSSGSHAISFANAGHHPGSRSCVPGCA